MVILRRRDTQAISGLTTEMSKNLVRNALFPIAFQNQLIPCISEVKKNQQESRRSDIV
jgi:ribosomal 50S subunit-associated protein YjgA (DUF615 family)